MSDITLYKPDHAWLYLDTERSIEVELQDTFSFFVPNYKFMPKYKYGMWDGKIKLYDLGKKRISAGLFHNVVKFASERDYSIDVHEDSLAFIHNKHMYDLDIPLTDDKGNHIKPRDYQLSGVNHIIQNHRGIVISPTGSGKSLMIYMLFRYFEDKKMLLIVPTTSLVEQMYKDFQDYSQKDDTINVIDEAHRIYSGHEKIADKRLVISTWQSIHKLPKSWFSKFEMVIGDEAHTFRANSLQTIMNNCVHAGIRAGTTGTLDGSLTNELVLTGLFGPKFVATTTKTLMDRNDLAKMTIEVIELKHEKISKIKYHDELAHLTADKKRTKFVSKLALQQKSNCLVLFNYIAHGKEIFEKIKELNTDKDRQIYFIAGEISTEEREKIRHDMENHKNAILVASLGTFSTGINIKNLHNIIFASPTKSQIRVLQSLGRGLRKFKDFKLKVYDIIDDYSGTRKDKNYAYKHGIQRLKIYAKERFNIKQWTLKL